MRTPNPETRAILATAEKFSSVAAGILARAGNRELATERLMRALYSAHAELAPTTRDILALRAVDWEFIAETLIEREAA